MDAARQLLQLAQFAAPSRAPAHRCANPRQRSMPLDAVQLENRILYSGSPWPIDVQPLADAGNLALDLPVPDQVIPLEPFGSTTRWLEPAADPGWEPLTDAGGITELAVTEMELPSLELVFVDGHIDDYESLIAELFDSVDSLRRFRVVILDIAKDGVTQISDVMRQHNDVAAVHLVSHGAGGQLQLGNAWLNSQTLDAYAPQLKGWNKSLKPGADLLIYGCDFASTEAGRDLADQLSRLGNCDVAASTDSTGMAALGGDWELEYVVGQLETEILFSQQLQNSWSGLLATFTVTTFDDVVDNADGLTSLREAIIASNASVTRDTVDLSQLGAGTFTLTIGGSGEDGALIGDLDITDDVMIAGAGPTATIIDASGMVGGRDRIFEIFNAVTTISDVTIQGGDVAAIGLDGGGIHVTSFGDLTLERVVIVDNKAWSGGGIRNNGYLTLIDVTIASNDGQEGGGLRNGDTAKLVNVTLVNNSAGKGAGIYNTGADLYLTNVTLSENWATAGEGGGLYNSGTATLQNVTVTKNTASVAGGGLATTAPTGVTNLSNTLVAGNLVGLTPEDLDGAFSSAGNNLVQNPGTATGLQPTDIINQDPNLGPLQDNGGFTETHALLAGSVAIDAATATSAPKMDQRGFLRDSLLDIGAFEANATSSSAVLWLSTEGNVVSGGAPGDDTWNAAEIIQFGDPNLSFGMGTTNGTFASIADLSAAGVSNITALHYVSSNVSVGSTTVVDLLAGDVLFSVGASLTLTSADLSTTSAGAHDVVLFRPQIPGDYSSGKFSVLLSSPLTNDLIALTLVQKNTILGDGTPLAAGTFLLIEAGPAANDIWHFTPDDVGALNDGISVQLIEGSDISIQSPGLFNGLELVEEDITIGGTNLLSGQLLATLTANDGTTGDNNLPTTPQDIFILDVTGTGVGTTAATATMFLEGSDVNLDAAAEDIDAFTIVSTAAVPPNSPPTDISPNSFSVDENIDTTGGYTLGTLTTTDPDAAESFSYSVLPGGDGALFSIGGVSSDELIVDDGILDFETKSTYSVTVRVTDSGLNTYDETITVTVHDLNEPPSDITLDNTSVAENMDGAIIGNLGVVDPDAGDTHTWSVDDSRFEIVAGQLKLKAGETLDYEIEPSVDVTITVTDQGGVGLSLAKMFTLTVTDANDVSPMVTVGQSFLVSEAAANGTPVGTVAATDIDTVGSFQDWTIVDGNADGIFAIDSLTGEITIGDNTKLDYESVTSYTLKISVGDGVNTSATEDVVINIVDVDESPAISPISDLAILESGSTGAIGFTIGDPETSAGLLTVTATSSDPSIIPDGNLVLGGSGASRTITATPLAGVSGGPVTITITVHDGTNTVVETFGVSVVPRVITVTTTADENDGDTTDLLTLMNAPGGTGISLREAIIAANNTLLGSTPDQIILPAGNYVLNRGSGDDSGNLGDLDIRHDVRISGGGSQTTIIDGNSLDSVFDIGDSSAASMTELTIRGAVNSRGAIHVDGNATLNLTDVTVRDNVGTAGGGAGHFHGTLNLNRVTLHNNSADSGGALYFHNADGGSLVNVTISGNTATSGEGGAIWTNTKITITNSTIVNNLGRSVGGIFAFDIDDVTLSNTILDNFGRNANQALTSAGHNIDSDGTAMLAGPMDQSGTLIAPLNVSLGALQDNGGSTLTHELLVGSIAVDRGTSSGAPVIDQRGTLRDSFVDIGAYEFVGGGNPPTALSPNSFAVDEHVDASAGYSLGAMIASDPDVGDSFTYEIWGGADQARFSIGGAGGDELILTDGILDYERQDSYSVLIRVRDSGNNAYFETVTVTINDLNDTPTAIAPTSFNLDENIDTSGGYSFGVLFTTDQDSPESFNYTIQGGPDQAKFNVGGAGSNELILTDGLLDFETQSTYTVIVRVTDSGGLTHDEVITVAVNDLNEAPTAITPALFIVDEFLDSSNGLSLGTLNTTDEDSLESFTYIILGGPDAAKFQIGGGGDQLILSDGFLDFERQSYYTVVVQVTDSGGNLYGETITVVVNDLNDAPVVGLLNTINTMAEDTNTTTSVKLADILVTDDALGSEILVLGGSDAIHFEIVGGNELHLKAGTSLDFESQALYQVTVNVDDLTLIGTPDDTTSFILTLTDVNEPVVAVDDYFSFPIAHSVFIAGPGVLMNDVDPENAFISLAILVAPEHGQVSLNPDGSFTYLPQRGFFGTDSFVYQADDGMTAPSQATATLNVTLPVANPPAGPGHDNHSQSHDDSHHRGSEAHEEQREENFAESIPVLPGVNTFSSGASSSSKSSGDRGASEFLTQGQFGSRVFAVSNRSDASFLWYAGHDTRDAESSSDSNSSFRSSLPLASAFINVLDEFREELADDDVMQKAIVGSTMAVSATLSVGYVIWLIRGGVLLSSVLSSLPAWRMVDPLPVLGWITDEEDLMGDDSLETIVEQSNLRQRQSVPS